MCGKKRSIAKFTSCNECKHTESPYLFDEFAVHLVILRQNRYRFFFKCSRWDTDISSKLHHWTLSRLEGIEEKEVEIVTYKDDVKVIELTSMFFLQACQLILFSDFVLDSTHTRTVSRESIIFSRCCFSSMCMT